MDGQFTRLIEEVVNGNNVDVNRDELIIEMAEIILWLESELENLRHEILG